MNTDTDLDIQAGTAPNGGEGCDTEATHDTTAPNGGAQADNCNTQDQDISSEASADGKSGEDGGKDGGEDGGKDGGEDGGENGGKDDGENGGENGGEDDSPAFDLISTIYGIAEIFVITMISTIFILSFCLRLCRVDGSSMNMTLKHGELLVITDFFYSPEQGDIVIFHLVNEDYEKALVKRVIATEGQTLEINFTDKLITVDGVIYPDEHAYLDNDEYKIYKAFDSRYIVVEDGKIYYRATVPEGHIFVLGDNRNNSSDSRSERVGFVDADCVLGKAAFRMSPFTWLDR